MGYKKADNQGVTKHELIMSTLKDYPMRQIGKWAQLVCLIRPDDFVLIDKAFGEKIGGKTLRVEQVFYHQNCQGNFMMKVDGYPSPISVDWAEDIIGRPSKT